MATSASSSQNTAGFKKPRLTVAAMLKEQLVSSNARIDQLMQEIKEQAAASNARIDQLMQENKELMDVLKQRLS